MYPANKVGGNCWRFYEPILLQAAYEKMMLTNGLHRGLERNEFYLHYQPQFARRLADMGIRVAVNISPRQIEITESVFIESMEDSIFKLCQLRDIRVILALDDFGTGYSSLTYLRSLPVGILKIDKSFIDKIINDKMQVQVVGLIIDLGHTLGLTIVAEGVETEEQLQNLRELGYIFSKPLGEEAATVLLKASEWKI